MTHNRDSNDRASNGRARSNGYARADAANGGGAASNGRARSANNADYGPLGPGKAPVKDPMRGLAGMMSGTLVMEAISIFLGLTVILKIDGGVYWTAPNWLAVTILGSLHVLAVFFARKPWAVKMILVLQALGLLMFFVHWSIGVIMLLFIGVWGFMLYLRSMLLERMRRGLLTTQHLGTD